MKPLAWSYSALDDYKNCARAYYEKRVAKSVKQEDTPEMIEGTRVHKAFELRQMLGAAKSPLPENLANHEGYMQRLEDMPGDYFATEHEIAFDKKGTPCSWQSPKDTIWCRGIIDYQKINGTHGKLVDYKTGKPHEKFEQLALFAIHTFAMFPIESVEATFYWTKTEKETHRIWSRAQIPMLWAMYLPHLRRYKESFKSGEFPPTRSGLCNGWCPVKDCEFWRPKREKRTAAPSNPEAWKPPTLMVGS